ncbi:Uncharacterised protein [Mycobacterium tuberculosis]|nr:Uncharacterised protein [Mycobacterium tuberculosis]
MNDPWPRPTQGPAKTIETDYLVIGAGAMGMAFTDTLITESGARVVMIDRHANLVDIGPPPTRSCGYTSHRPITASTQGH